MTDTTITEIRVATAQLPWPDTWLLDGQAMSPTRNLLVVEVQIASGVAGMGYLHLLTPALRTLQTCISEIMAPRVLGKDATAVEAIGRDLWRATLTSGRGGITTMAISAIDIALWDIVGKVAGLPLHRLWGNFCSQIPAYGSGCFRGSGGEGMIKKARHYAEQGFSAIKMQVAHVHDLATDLDNVRRMREALGPGIEIMIDVNQGWSADTAILMGRKFEQYDIHWLEEPVIADDFAGYMRVADKLDLRVVGGETHFTRYDMRPFLEHPGLPILQPDPMRGGLTEMRKLATLADTWGMTIAPHLFPELVVHVLCSIPNASWIEHMGLLDDLWVEALPVRGGRISAPERPGHGLAFKPEVLANFQAWETLTRSS